MIMRMVMVVTMIIVFFVFFDPAHRVYTGVYDAVSDVVESGGQWRSNFQIGSGVLKNCYKSILMHIYGIHCDFMHRSC